METITDVLKMLATATGSIVIFLLSTHIKGKYELNSKHKEKMLLILSEIDSIIMHIDANLVKISDICAYESKKKWIS